MKRRIAAVLATFLMIQSPLGAVSTLAAGSQSVNALVGQNRIKKASESDADRNEPEQESPDYGIASASETYGTGRIRIEMHNVLQSAESIWSMELYRTNQAGEILSLEAESLILPENTGNGRTVSVYTGEVENGIYTLRLTPAFEDNSYLPYEQSGIKINSNQVTLQLMNDLEEMHGYEKQNDKYAFGLLRMGDINMDEVLDEQDQRYLLELIAETEEDLTVLERADLNMDGNVDLLDVSLFAKHYEEKSRKAEVYSSLWVKPEEIKATVSDAEYAPDSIKVEELFSGTGEEQPERKLQIETAEPLSPEKPAVISSEFEEPKQMAGFTIDPVQGSPNTIVDAVIDVEVIRNGKTETEQFVVKNGKVQTKGLRGLLSRLRTVLAEDTLPLQGSAIVIDLGNQVPVKKISIQVSKTMSQDAKLVDISKVEFLGDMAERIPEPQMSIPDRLEVENGDAEFTLHWRKQSNVTGYEIAVSGETDQGMRQESFITETNELTVASINGGKLRNGKTYHISIRSINGSWKSGSAETSATPVAMSLPPAPDDLVITPGYKRLSISWKDMKDTDVYTLYYREKADADMEFKSVEGIEGTSYELKGLKDVTEYELYLTGNNRLGEGPESAHHVAATESLNPPVTPNYRLINIPNEEGKSAHIQSILSKNGSMDHEFAVADGNYETTWWVGDWDSGASYYSYAKAPVITFDEAYQMDTIVMIPDLELESKTFMARLYYWQEGDRVGIDSPKSVGGTLRQGTSNGKKYYTFETDVPVTAKAVQFTVSSYIRQVSYAELKFYYYDSLEDEIMGLYADHYHVNLNAEVDQNRIDELRSRLNTPDEVSQEYHPKKAQLEIELNNAERILRDGKLQAEILYVDAKDTAKEDTHIGFVRGQNTFQPLGVTAAAGESITVYVGAEGRQPGTATNLKLVQTQYHGTSAAWYKDLGVLKAGANEFILDPISTMQVEQGGQLYVVYTGNKGAEQYGVRVSGGTRIPVLDLSDLTEKEERLEKIKKYLQEVDTTYAGLEEMHAADHKGENKKTEDSYEWDPKNCIYGATDLVTRYSMLSLSIEQVLNGLGEGTIEERAERLEQSLRAMDQMILLFYQHKGLNDSEGTPKLNYLPVSRLNIRYQRMFAGAFMYAGGSHIGVEWDQLPDLMRGVPVQTDENGRYQSGELFGWGIAHEIGHSINPGSYEVAEVTNNYYSMLATSKNSNDSARFSYDAVYNKVTSGTSGKAADVFTQLAMYWQLHLAYDLGGYNYKIYSDHEEQLENLFFARVESYLRNTGSAPQPGGIALNLNTDKDNKLMRLAVAAAEKNLLEFFVRWGYVPNQGTVDYAEQFAEETRGIWLANDDNHAAQLEAGTEPGDGSNGEEILAELSYQPGSNAVEVQIEGNGNSWIYEIYRYEYIKGTKEERPVGYAYADEDGTAVFTDVIGTLNNRSFTYEVVGYDLRLNPSIRVEAGTVKVSHDGTLDRSLWQVSSNLTNEELEGPNEYHPDSTVQPGMEKMIDSDTGARTSFIGSSEEGQIPEIILHLNQMEVVTGLRYTAAADAGAEAISDFRIYISEDGSNWQEVKTEKKRFELEDGSQTIYFNDGKNLYSYDVAYVKLTAPSQKGRELIITDLSLLGQTGDNIELSTEGMGILKKDYQYGESEEEKIPAGSLVFTGSYKGNPAYNAVLLWDDQGELVAGSDAEGTLYASQLIFAPEPENGGLLGEVSDGIWIYYIEEAYAESWIQEKPHKIRAELYRVDDAETNEGERLTSSSGFAAVPDELPEIEIQKKRSNEAAYKKTELLHATQNEG